MTAGVDGLILAHTAFTAMGHRIRRSRQPSPYV